MKKKIFAVILVLVLAGLIAGGVYIFSGKKENYSYTVEEQQWIDANKNNAIDLYMPTGVASLTLDSEGLFFDFMTYFTDDTGITMRASEYDPEIEGEYSIDIVSKVEKDDIEILKDNYVVISKKNGIYKDVKSLAGLKIGYIKAEGEEIAKSIDPTTVTFIGFDDRETLLNALNTNVVDSIIGLKTSYLDQILINNYHISYHILDMPRYYVLRINSDDDVRNSIVRKEMNKFINEKLKQSYNENLLNTYIKTLNISEKDLNKLNSKVYTYGFVENGIYDNTTHRSLSGTNYFIIKDFALFAQVDMNYAEEYKSLKKLDKALNDKKIDFYFDTTSLNNDEDSIMPIESTIVFLTNNSNNVSINNLNSLKNYKVSVIENSKIEALLKENDIATTSYSNYSSLFKKMNSDTIIAMDLGNYEYYKTRKLNNYHISYLYDNNIYYGYKVREDNDIFMKLFNFYLEYTNLDAIVNIDYANAYEYEGLNIFLFIAVVILSLIIILQFFGRIRKFIVFLFKHKKTHLSKDEKLKYIDSLTSLKNRVYLNDNMEKWDNSEIYPQVIIIVDLNNIAYINDNFGHEEGDKVITEAANILIQSQMPNTEILRTDGNEFLIYMVDYEEKKAVAYIRKLNREFKNLTHGFGAAIGYSIISDAIKTLDDAINEATLDMKTNKELMIEEEK